MCCLPCCVAKAVPNLPSVGIIGLHLQACHKETVSHEYIRIQTDTLKMIVDFCYVKT